MCIVQAVMQAYVEKGLVSAQEQIKLVTYSRILVSVGLGCFIPLQMQYFCGMYVLICSWCTLLPSYPNWSWPSRHWRYLHCKSWWGSSRQNVGPEESPEKRTRDSEIMRIKRPRVPEANVLFWTTLKAWWVEARNSNWELSTIRYSFQRLSSTYLIMPYRDKLGQPYKANLARPCQGDLCEKTRKKEVWGRSESRSLRSLAYGADGAYVIWDLAPRGWEQQISH